MTLHNAIETTLGGLLMLGVLGCGSGPARIDAPSLSASRIAQAAIDQYDTDGDGTITGAELEQAPSLKASVASLDSDGDGGVSESEIAARVKSWMSSGLGLTAIMCKVTLDGRPLSGATVTFEPEEFQGEAVKPGVGETGTDGVASPSIAKEDRQNPLFGGMSVGLYKVRISKPANGRETIPAKYNTETILGQEIAVDGANMDDRYLTFALESK